jgi:hypothetical protein
MTLLHHTGSSHIDELISKYKFRCSYAQPFIDLQIWKGREHLLLGALTQIAEKIHAGSDDINAIFGAEATIESQTSEQWQNAFVFLRDLKKLAIDAGLFQLSSGLYNMEYTLKLLLWKQDPQVQQHGFGTFDHSLNSSFL